MKNFQYFLGFILLSFIYYSCTDEGVLPNNKYKGEITLSFSNLKTLDAATDGTYEAWVYFNVADTNRYFRSIGRFNVNVTGTAVDEAGNPKAFSLNGDTGNLNYAQYCM